MIGAQVPEQLARGVRIAVSVSASSRPAEYELRRAVIDSSEQNFKSHFSRHSPCSLIVLACSRHDLPVAAHVGHRLPSGIYRMAQSRGRRAPKKSVQINSSIICCPFQSCSFRSGPRVRSGYSSYVMAVKVWQGTPCYHVTCKGGSTTQHVSRRTWADAVGAMNAVA